MVSLGLNGLIKCSWWWSRNDIALMLFQGHWGQIQPFCLKPRSHMYCNLSATALRLKTAATNATTVQSKRHFFGCRSIGDWSATTIPKSRRPVEDRSATGGRLIANWLEMGCDWSATGWRLVVDRSAISWRLTIEQTICCVGVIVNKALINCYSMAISIYIYWLCHIVYFHSYYN